MFWNISTAISGIAIVIYLANLTLVIFSRPVSHLKKIFAFYLVFMVIWSLSAFLSSSGLVAVLPWFRMMAGAPLAMVLAIFLFVQDLFGLRTRWLPFIILYVVGTIVATLLTDSVVMSASLDPTGTLSYQFGSWLPLIAGPTFILILYSIYQLIQGYRRSTDDTHRNRIRYLTLGLTITILSSLFNLTKLGKYPIDIAANVITAVLISYAILRHQLLDIRVVIRVGLLYSITTTLVGAIYFLGITIALNIFHLLPSKEIVTMSILLSLLVAFILAPIRSRTQDWVDRLFYREKYSAGLMLQRMSQATASLLALDQIAGLILSEVLSTWHIHNGAVLIKKTINGEFRVIAQQGENLDHAWTFPTDHPVVSWLVQSKKPLTRNDLEMNPIFKSLWGLEKQKLDRFQAEIFIPVSFKENLVGILILGQKMSTQPYNRDDLLFLSALSNQTAVAFENARLYDELESTFVQTTIALANAIDIRDTYTNIHSQQIANWSLETARLLGCNEAVIEETYWGGLLHDIGKIGIPDSILNKAASLDAGEWEVVKKHPNLGAELISPIKKLANVAPIIRCSHERFDGTGYPGGLRMEEIPIGARIVSVADSYSAMRDTRPYKKPFSKEKAVKELVDNKGTMYDPLVVDAFLKIIIKID